MEAIGGPAVPLARAAGTILILYGTLLGLWSQQHNESPALLTAIRHWFNRPLGIGEDFTMLGVLLLLLAAGYESAGAAPAARALAIRLARLYAPILAATTLAALLTHVPTVIWTNPMGATAGLADYARNLGLVGQVTAGVTVLVPLAWVVALEIVARLGSVLDSVVRGDLPVVETIGLAAVAGVLFAAAHGQLGQLAVVLSSYPLVVIGQAIRRTRDGTLPIWATALLGVAGWALLGWAEHVCPALAGWWYPLTAAYAIPLFALAVVTGGEVAERIAAAPITHWLATRAQWIVLLAGVAGFPMLALLQGRTSQVTAVLPAVAVTCLVAEAGHRLANWRAAPR
jgi:hypothetical protein